MTIRLVALDIDGTLLDDRKQLVAENREALREAERRGILLCIASGRMVSTILGVEKQLGVDCIIIAYNGGLVVGRKSEGRPQVIHRPVPAEVAEFFIGFSHEHRCLLNFYHEDRLYAEKQNRGHPLAEVYARRTGAGYIFVRDLRLSFPGVDPTKLILLAGASECDRLLPELRSKLEDKACIVKSEPEYIEITAPGIDKGSALPLIADRYGMAIEEIMAVGDAENDVSMLRVAGLGVAMANAPAAVKATARFVTEQTNNHGGAAEAVYRWALS